ncbi:HAMP domain-containing sensor histidine kinase [Clostridiaceae bacterium M8S5]|nr:HAMP domain-containing sensor histidine kinase [Clostridiaceae bacterium M8S5]
MKLFKSLFGKMLIIYVSIIIVSFIILGFIVSNALESYFTDQKEQKLIEQCEKIQRQVTLIQQTGRPDFDKLKFEIDALETYLNSRIWIMDRTGIIYVNSSKENIELYRQVMKEEIDDVFNGYIIKRHGEFNKQLNETVLTIGYPIVSNKSVIMALFMHASMPEVNKTISDIYNITVIVLGFALIIGIVSFFIVSRTLKRKIYKLSDASKRFAKGNFTDIEVHGTDELDQLAESFNQMSKELKKVDKMRKDFISNLSHDLRSPLTSIKGYARALIDGTVDRDNQNKYLNIILEESDRLSKMTNDILDLSKIESGNYELDLSNFSINEMILNQIEKFEVLLKEKEVYVKINLCEDKDIVFADRDKINRVVYNLIDNAVKFVDVNGRLTITTTKIGEFISISIYNSGEIIPKEELDYIWERFVKLDKSRGKNKKGSGLGLAIVKSILDSHNAEIVALSDKTGTQFKFKLKKS